MFHLILKNHSGDPFLSRTIYDTLNGALAASFSETMMGVVEVTREGNIIHHPIYKVGWYFATAKDTLGSAAGRQCVVYLDASGDLWCYLNRHGVPEGRVTREYYVLGQYIGNGP